MGELCCEAACVWTFGVIKPNTLAGPTSFSLLSSTNKDKTHEWQGFS